MRADLSAIVSAALAAVDAGALVATSLASTDIVTRLQGAERLYVLAAGKAAAPMLDAFVARSAKPAVHLLGIGPVGSEVPRGAEWVEAGHPVPTEGSVRGARRALEMARGVGGGDVLLVLLSGGGSALMALPAEGVSLEDKRRTVQRLLESSADIHELNTVRKHVSAIKGGQLAAAVAGQTVTLAVSDVVGDDLSVIASGPTVPDASTFADALAVLGRRGGQSAYPPSVVARITAGAAGAIPETPARDDARLSRAFARVIGRQRGALEDAAAAARSLGYTVLIVAEPVTGEARESGPAHVRRITALIAGVPRPVCVLSAGETTVTVRGQGRGGRNQEFACSAAPFVGALGPSVVLASVGTDGIDGPTDAAGALVDASTVSRAAAQGLDLAAHLDRNDTYTFFDAMGDLIRTGPTRTNVGDLQIVLVG